MGFFKALAPLLARGAITIRVSQDKDEGKVKLLITQVPEKEGDVGLPPLRHVDAPEQLDQTLEAEIAALIAHRDGPVQSVLDQAKAAMDEAAAEEKRKADEKAASSRKKPGAATAKVAAGKPQRFSLDTPEGSGEGGKPPGSEGAEDAEPASAQATGGAAEPATIEAAEDLFS